MRFAWQRLFSRGWGMNVYRVFYRTLGVTLLLLAMNLFDALPGLRIEVVAGCLVGAGMCAVLALGFRRDWKGGRVTIPLLAGAIFIVGGAAFDIYATLHHSPDLEHEANPLARTLLDEGLAPATVLMLGGIGQACLVFTSLMIWMNLVIRFKWYEGKIGTSERSGLAGKVLLVNRMFGAPDNGLASLLGMRTDPEVLICGVGFLMLPLYAYRWYLGLEWFGLVPISRIVVPVSLVVLALAVQFIWATRMSRASPG